VRALTRAPGAARRDEAQRRHLLELAHHTCLLVAEAAAAPTPETAAQTPSAAARLFAALTASAAGLMCYAAGGADGAWGAVASAFAAHPDGGRHTRALLDAATAALQVLRPRAEHDAAAEGEAPLRVPDASELAPAAEGALDATLQLLLVQPPGGGFAQLRPELTAHLLAKRASSTGGPPVGLRAAVRLCTAALAANAHTTAGARCAARGAALLLALATSPGAAVLDEVCADPELLALARPLFALAADHLRACLARPAHAAAAVPLARAAGDARAAAAAAEAVVAEAALQTATLRLCALLLDDSTTRRQAVAALAPALGACLADEPRAFAARWCGGADAAARHPPWVAQLVRTLVGGAPGDAHVPGWGGSAAEQSAALFGLLANMQCHSPKLAAGEAPGAGAHTLAVHAAACGPAGGANSVANLTALLGFVLGTATTPPLCAVPALDAQLVMQLAEVLARVQRERRAA
jgi:hypothetical protein